MTIAGNSRTIFRHALAGASRWSHWRGKPMIQRVWERARQAKRIGRVIIATDDERILKGCRRIWR